MEGRSSPYRGISADRWRDRTEELLAEYPLDAEQIYAPVLDAWDSIFESTIGRHGIQIGKDIFPTPQIMASYLHELIPLEFAFRYPGDWRGDEAASEKDLVHLPDDNYSMEIKTSSSPRNIYANRSYAQAESAAKKNKNGYYLAINFSKFSKRSKDQQRPPIRLIRFGWLDHTDWRGQKEPTGQQARLSPESDRGKLLPIYES